MYDTAKCFPGTGMVVLIKVYLVYIAKVLKVGIIVLKSNAPMIYCIPGGHTQYKYYIIIYNQDQGHYQLGLFKNNTTNSEHTFFACKNIPVWLKNTYNTNCHNSQIKC